jgi:hypothetical protein
VGLDAPVGFVAVFLDVLAGSAKLTDAPRIGE